jgi:hypothetical protein
MPEQPEQKQETVGEVVAAMRRYADILAAAPVDPLAQDIARLLREYADRVELAIAAGIGLIRATIDDIICDCNGALANERMRNIYIKSAKDCAKDALRRIFLLAECESARNAAKIAKAMNDLEKGRAK